MSALKWIKTFHIISEKVLCSMNFFIEQNIALISLKTKLLYNAQWIFKEIYLYDVNIQIIWCMAVIVHHLLRV